MRGLALAGALLAGCTPAAAEDGRFAALRETWSPMAFVEVSIGGHALRVSETELTQSQWTELSPPETVNGQPARTYGRRGPWIGDGPEPMVGLTFCGSLGLANALSEREGLTPVYEVAGEQCQETTRRAGATGFRLLTRAEWLALAKGAWPEGALTEDRRCELANLADRDTYTFLEADVPEGACSDGHGELAPACSFPRGAHGLCDLLGNVEEIVHGERAGAADWMGGSWLSRESLEELRADAYAEQAPGLRALSLAPTRLQGGLRLACEGCGP